MFHTPVVLFHLLDDHGSEDSLQGRGSLELGTLIQSWVLVQLGYFPACHLASSLPYQSWGEAPRTDAGIGSMLHCAWAFTAFCTKFG